MPSYEALSAPILMIAAFFEMGEQAKLPHEWMCRECYHSVNAYIWALRNTDPRSESERRYAAEKMPHAELCRDHWWALWWVTWPCSTWEQRVQWRQRAVQIEKRWQPWVP